LPVEVGRKTVCTGCRQQPKIHQLLQPLTILYVALTSRHVFDLIGKGV